jgi:hypothetical protein
MAFEAQPERFQSPSLYLGHGFTTASTYLLSRFPSGTFHP